MSLAFASLFLAGLLGTISWIDFRQMIIPDLLNLALATSGVVVSILLLENSLLSILLQSAAVFAAMWGLASGYERFRKISGLGGGDIKFLSAATCWVSLLGLPWVLLLGSLSALSFAAVSHLLGHFKAGQRLAFGPHLSLGLFATWMLRDELFNFQI